MGRGKLVIQIFLALFLATVAGILTFRFSASHRPRPVVAEQKAPQNTEMVVVAGAEIPRGTMLSPEMLKVVPYLKDNLPLKYFTDPNQVEGRYPLVPLGLNELVTESRLASPEASRGISFEIPPGKRALAVQGNKVMGLAGFIRPGNHVDVMVTLDDQRIPGQVVTKTVLENLRVLATGTELEENAQGEFSPVDTYTLEVSPEQGEMLSLAATKGTLHFALRNPEDESPVRTEGMDIVRAVSALKPARENTKVPEVKKVRKTVAKAPEEPEPIKVQVIRGVDISQVEF